MSGCTCGGFTATTHKRSAGSRLTWERCGACGRCDGFELRHDDELVAMGEAARRFEGPLQEAKR